MIGYKTRINFTGDDLDEKGMIKTSSLFRMFQDVSEKHVDSINMGVGELIKRNYIWVLSKLKFRIYSTISEDREYTIATYPKPKKNVTFGRNYYIFDSDDNTIVSGISQWCIINYKTRKIEKSDIDYHGEFHKGNPFMGVFEKIHGNRLILSGEHSVVPSDLDINKHVNNCRYVDLICETAGRNCFYEFNVFFAKESVLGDKLLLYREEKNDGSLIVFGKREDSGVVFKAEGKASGINVENRQ